MRSSQITLRTCYIDCDEGTGGAFVTEVGERTATGFRPTHAHLPGDVGLQFIAACRVINYIDRKIAQQSRLRSLSFYTAGQTRLTAASLTNYDRLAVYTRRLYWIQQQQGLNW